MHLDADGQKRPCFLARVGLGLSSRFVNAINFLEIASGK